MSSEYPFSTKAKENQIHLRILETTDLHVHIHPYDYYADQSSDRVGLARAATMIERLRGDAANTLLVDNGDFLQGSPMGDYMAYEHGLGDGTVHPMLKAMNVLGYDAGTIGNHEFNYGLEFLMDALSGAAFPMVCANVERGGQPLVEPYVLLDRTFVDGQGMRHTLKIGVIGFVPPQVMVWDRQNLAGKVTARDIVEAARVYVPQMKAAGADIVLALSHSGIGAAEHSLGMEDASVPLAAIEGIDALVTGHSHLVFPSAQFEGMAGVDAERGTLQGKPAVMAGSWGSHLGLMDLLLAPGDAGWQVVEARSEAISLGGDATLTPRADVIDSVSAEHAATLEYVRRPVGRTAIPLHSYFALVADAPSVRLVQKAQAKHVREKLKGTNWEGLPVLSAASPFKAGGRGGPQFYTDVPAGDLAFRHIADLYLYPNNLCAILLSGAELMDWLECAVSLYHQITPGLADQPLLNSGLPSHTFDMLAGLRYEVDLSKPARCGPEGKLINPDAARICKLTYDGAPLDREAKFVVATNNYRADGGGAFPAANGETVIFKGRETVRDVLMEYVAAQGEIGADNGPSWRFKSMPGTSVLFETGPGAAGQPDCDTYELIGPQSDGFLQFRLRL